MKGRATFPKTTEKLESDRPTGMTVNVVLLREQVPEVAKQVVFALVEKVVGNVITNYVRALSKDECRAKGVDIARVKLEA